MSITVRLIFWGLIGFVPNGDQGMTALLVDPEAAQADHQNVNPACAVPPHLSVVYLFDGECDQGDCRRVPPGRVNDSRRMGFDRTVHGKDLPLAWLLNKEDLDIVGDENVAARLRKPFFGSNRKVAPTSKRQTSYFSWVQSMSALTGGQAQIGSDCLEGKASCPIQARFTVEGGRAGACHLFHFPKAPQAKDDRRELRIFEYTVPGQPSFFRAVADAVLVEFEVEGDSVLLLSRKLPERPPSTAWARLKPVNGKLTLVVANFPPRSNSHGTAAPHPGHSCVPPHSDSLLDLLAQTPKLIAVRRETDRRGEKVVPGSCEPEANILAELLTRPGEPPHSTTACDGRTIP